MITAAAQPISPAALTIDGTSAAGAVTTTRSGGEGRALRLVRWRHRQLPGAGIDEEN